MKFHAIDPKITVRRAVAAYGSQTALARELKVTRSLVAGWVHYKTKYLPPLHAYRLRELRPDLFKR